MFVVCSHAVRQERSLGWRNETFENRVHRMVGALPVLGATAEKSAAILNLL